MAALMIFLGATTTAILQINDVKQPWIFYNVGFVAGVFSTGLAHKLGGFFAF